jgi:hypothetical protein
MTSGLSLKIIVLLQVALFFALASTMVLFTVKMRDLVIQTVASRFMVVSTGVAHEVEQALSLGLGLGEWRDLDRILRREAAREPAIGSLTLFSASGAVVASVGPAAVTGQVPDAWLRLLRRDFGSGAPGAGAARASRLVEGDTQIIVSGLRNAFGDLGGGVALTSSLAPVYRDLRGIYPRMVLGGGLCLLGGIAVTSLAVWLALRPTRRVLAEALAWVRGLDGATLAPVPPGCLRLLPGLDGFGARVAAGHRVLDPGGPGQGWPAPDPVAPTAPEAGS